jgi:hypothetical protein
MLTETFDRNRYRLTETFDRNRYRLTEISNEIISKFRFPKISPDRFPSMDAAERVAAAEAKAEAADAAPAFAQEGAAVPATAPSSPTKSVAADAPSSPTNTVGTDTEGPTVFWPRITLNVLPSHLRRSVVDVSSGPTAKRVYYEVGTGMPPRKMGRQGLPVAKGSEGMRAPLPTVGPETVGPGAEADSGGEDFQNVEMPSVGICYPPPKRAKGSK